MGWVRWGEGGSQLWVLVLSVVFGVGGRLTVLCAYKISEKPGLGSMG